VTIALIPIIVMAVLYACGVSLMLERSVTRVLLGFLLVGNATNLLLIIMAGKAGVAPIVGGGIPAEDMTDPLPQALILTAIVITFGVSAFLLALIYRAWRLEQGDTLQDDEDDIALRTSLGVPGENSEDTTSDSDFVDDGGTELHELEEADAQAAAAETEQSTITTDRVDS
jgi:multicomponent Na+:H+ antiporter subunit C